VYSALKADFSALMRYINSRFTLLYFAVYRPTGSSFLLCEFFSFKV